jgi:hypothetical protein
MTDLELLDIAKNADADAGEPFLLWMLKGDVLVGDFRARILLILHAAVAAESARRDAERCVWRVDRNIRGQFVTGRFNGDTSCGREFCTEDGDTTRPCWCGKTIEIEEAPNG